MSEERRISLAELLAREGGAPAPASGRRRRHRGGEDSITVAELTGEIPVIRDAKRAVDEPVEQPVAPEPVAAEPVVEEPVVEQSAAEESAAEEPVAEEAAEEPTVEEAAADVVEEPATAAPVEAEVLEDEVVEHNTTEGREETNFAWSRWDEAETPIMATADFNTAQVRERQARLAEVEGDDTVDVAPVTDVPDDVDAPSAPDTAALSAAQIDEARAAALADEAEGAAGEAAAPDAAREPGRARGWLLLGAEVVLGALAGAGLFYGFFKLWNWGGGMPTIALTVVLAFIVIIAIVTFTHYLRKTTDFLTLGLALLVGLVITFGPLLMALGTD